MVSTLHIEVNVWMDYNFPQKIMDIITYACPNLNWYLLLKEDPGIVSTDNSKFWSTINNLLQKTPTSSYTKCYKWLESVTRAEFQI